MHEARGTQHEAKPGKITLVYFERMNKMLQDKKVIIIGDRDGIPAPAIEECVKSIGAEVVFASTECFV